MQFHDIRTLPPNEQVETDVCLVGAGPVGLTIATELAGSGLRIVLLESGGREPDAWADSLNQIENIGAPRVMDQTLVRNRGLGGTSRTWSGRIATFDTQDFESRGWMPNSGWPISRNSLLPYFSRALPHIGGEIADNTDTSFKRDVLRGTANQFDAKIFEDYVWSYSRDATRNRDFMRFGPRAEKIDGRTVSGFLNATVTHINTDLEGRLVTGLEVFGPDNQPRFVAAALTVLCAGGIENARLLLASRRTLPQGVGNRHDQVGRYLMDHLRGPVAAYDPPAFLDAQAAFGSFRKRVNQRTVVLTRGVALSPALQEREGLLAAAAWLNGDVAADDPLMAIGQLARLRGSPVAEVGKIVRSAPIIVRGLSRLGANRSPLRKLRWLNLECIVEQPPRPESRVTLSDRTDALGIPLSKVDWRVGDAEGRTMRALAVRFCEESRRLRLPIPRVADWVLDDAAPLPMQDVAHPIGTTRMSADPKAGVVDLDCRVHGIANLYVAGASTFPTSGHANPTQTALAMAIRLADHLRGLTFSPVPHANPSKPHAPRVLPRPTRAPEAPLILVTGATGKVGSALLPLLISKGYGVRALTSRIAPSHTDSKVTWVTRDLRRADLDFSAEVEGCTGIVHLGAELRHPADMERTNIEATRALAQAAEDAAVRTMVYTSSVSVYGSQVKANVSEEANTLTHDRDVQSEYWADDALRTYGRTKLGGELAIRDVAKTVSYVIFRPAVIVDEADIVAVLGWSTARRALLAHRNTNHVYVGDVAAAIVWALERKHPNDRTAPTIDIFNLADESLDDPTFGGLLGEASLMLEPLPFTPVPRLPRIVDWGKDIIRYHRSIIPRRPLGMMRFPISRLRSAGFELPTGMARVRARAFSGPSAQTDIIPREPERPTTG